jgi:hypothetical protein
MKHLLHHEPRHGRGKVNVYAGVTVKDFDFTADQTAFLKTALKDNLTTTLMVSDIHGITLVAYPKATGDSTEASVLSGVLATLRPAVQVEVAPGGAQWDKY